MCANPEIWPIIIAWGKGEQPSQQAQQKLLAWELDGPNRLWHRPSPQTTKKIATEKIATALERRGNLLQRTIENSGQNKDQNNGTFPLPGPWTDWIVPLWTFWLPLAQQLDHKQRELSAPFIQGILGGQGTGKTTLTKILQLILGHLQQLTACLSIDDLYLTYEQRLALKQQDPRLIWRGPPGTHDIQLGLETLDKIKNAQPGARLMLPQFDKSRHNGQGDRSNPLEIPAPNILLFEGWFVGTQPIDNTIFSNTEVLPNPIISPTDRQFAADNNRRLHDYRPLWNRLDSLMVLYPEDYRLSQRWRLQAEQSMKAQGKSGLSDEEIEAFVTYFWKALHPQLFITPLTQSEKIELVVTIRADHSLGELSTPAIGNYNSDVFNDLA